MRTIFALPGFEERGVLLDEVEQVLLGLGREAPGFFNGGGALLLGGQGAPQVVDLALQVFGALPLAGEFFIQRQLGGALVAVDADVHQGVAGVEEELDLFFAVALLAFGEVVAGEDQVINDGVGVGPLAEEVVAFEETVVAIGGMGDHQGLHRHGVFFHEVGDAGVGVDDDLVGEAHLAAPVAFFGLQEALAEGPVVVIDGHADGRVGVHHLLGGDDLDLDGVGVEAEFARHAVDLGVVGLDEFEGPLARGREGLPALGSGRCAHASFFLKSSRNTG